MSRILNWLVAAQRATYALGYRFFGLRFARFVRLRIVLLRHGQAEHNTEAAAGHSDLWCTAELTRRGRSQARVAGIRLAALLADSDWVYCYRSPFPRCVVTLTEVLVGAACTEADLRVFEAPEVREWNAGCEHKRTTGAPELSDIYREPPLGESIDACRSRASLFLARLVRDLPRYTPKRILIVTHGIWSLCFIARFFHLTDEQFLTLKNLDNCQYVEIAPTRSLSGCEFEWRGWGVRGIGTRD